MNPSSSIKGQIDSFLESVVQVKQNLVAAIPLATDPSQKKIMEELLATMENRQAEFESLAPAALQAAKEKHAKTMAKFHELVEQKKQLRERISQLTGKIEEAKMAVMKKAEEAKLNPKSIPLRPVKLAKTAEEPQLSSGDALREMLLAPDLNGDPNKTSQPGIGNIWEKWNPNN